MRIAALERLELVDVAPMLAAEEAYCFPGGNCVVGDASRPSVGHHPVRFLDVDGSEDPTLAGGRNVAHKCVEPMGRHTDAKAAQAAFSHLPTA